MRASLWLGVLASALGGAGCGSGGGGGGFGAASGSDPFPSGPLLDCQAGDLDLAASTSAGLSVLALDPVTHFEPIKIGGQPGFESNPVGLCVPPDAVSLVLYGAMTTEVLASSYVASGLGELVDTSTIEKVARVQAPELMLPKGPEVLLHPGRHSFRLAGEVVAQAWPKLAIRRGARADNSRYRLNLIFVDGSGIDASTIQAFADAAGIFDQIYAQVGVGVSALGAGVIHDPMLAVLPADNSVLLTQANRESSAELPLLPDALDLYFVRELLSSDTAGTLLGRTMGLPGVPSIPEKSGVVLSVDAHRNGLELDFEAIWITAAHEGAHWHGLRHTTERWGTIQDLVADTPECSQFRDLDKNGLVDAKECAGAGAQNLMFWTYDPGAPPTQLTPGQGFVLSSALSMVPQ